AGGDPARDARCREGARRRPAARKPASRVVCARKRKRGTAGGRSDTERAPPCLGTIFTSPTGEKAWTIQKEWTCRATPRRVRRRWCWRANSDTAKSSRAGPGRDGSSPWWTSMATRWIACRSPTCRTNKGCHSLVLAGALSLHGPEVGPPVHHPPVGKPAEAVLAARALANLALAAALSAEYRRRIRKRPRALRADDQHATKINPIDRRISFVLRFAFDILSHGDEAPDASALRRRNRRHGQRRSGDHGRGFSQSTRRGQALAVAAHAPLSVDSVLARSYAH